MIISLWSFFALYFFKTYFISSLLILYPAFSPVPSSALPSAFSTSLLGSFLRRFSSSFLAFSSAFSFSFSSFFVFFSCKYLSLLPCSFRSFAVRVIDCHHIKSTTPTSIAESPNHIPAPKTAIIPVTRVAMVNNTIPYKYFLVVKSP